VSRKVLLVHSEAFRKESEGKSASGAFEFREEDYVKRAKKKIDVLLNWSMSTKDQFFGKTDLLKKDMKVYRKKIGELNLIVNK